MKGPSRGKFELAGMMATTTMSHTWRRRHGTHPFPSFFCPGTLTHSPREETSGLVLVSTKVWYVSSSLYLVVRSKSVGEKRKHTKDEIFFARGALVFHVAATLNTPTLSQANTHDSNLTTHSLFFFGSKSKSMREFWLWELPTSSSIYLKGILLKHRPVSLRKFLRLMGGCSHFFGNLAVERSE